MLEWKLPSSRPGLTGYIDRSQPHAINSILVGKLGNQEILVCACDDGDIVAYYTSVIQAAIDGQELGLTEEEVIKLYLRPLLLTNIEKSAWGLAIHSNARLIAASCNKHDITVFSFALTKDAILYEEIPDSTKIDAIKLDSRERDTEFTLCGHHHNIPNISFLNADSDKEGRYLVSTDLTGTILIWDLRRRCGIKHIPPIEDIRSVHARSGWSVVCIDTLSAQCAESSQELLGCKTVGDDKQLVDITASRMTLRDSALTSTPFYRHLHGRDADDADLSFADLINQRVDTEFERMFEQMADPDGEGDSLAIFEEDGDDFWPDVEDEIDYEDEMEEVVWDNGTATDPRPSLLEQGFITANGESVNLPRPMHSDPMPWRELTQSPQEPITQPLPWMNPTPHSPPDRLFQPPTTYDISTAWGARINPRPREPITQPLQGTDLSRRLVVPPLLDRTRSPPSVDTDTAVEAMRRTPGLSEALASGDVVTEDLLSTAFGDPQRPDQAFRRATQHPQLRSFAQSMNDVRAEREKLSSRLLAQEAQVSANLNLPFAIFHTGVDYANLHRPSFDKTSVVTCRDPCHQHLPPNLVWLSQVDRLHLTQYIPDIDIIVTATAAGRAAIFSLTRGVISSGSKSKGKNGHQQPELAMRLDWVLPFASQEERGERPPMVLIGIATAPLQGLDDSSNNDAASSSSSSANRRPKARWRLFLTYEDHTVLSYELWRGGKGKKAEHVAMEEGMVF